MSGDVDPSVDYRTTSTRAEATQIAGNKRDTASCPTGRIAECCRARERTRDHLAMLQPRDGEPRLQ